jgi:hypothetical protein
MFLAVISSMKFGRAVLRRFGFILTTGLVLPLLYLVSIGTPGDAR